MSLNIKNREAHALARELAKETGESMTRAIIEALRERLDRVRRQRGNEARVEEVLAIGRRCAKLLAREPTEHGSLLYDERGIPR